MSFIKLQCKICKNNKLKSKTDFGSVYILEFECGHLNEVSIVNRKAEIDISTSTDGKKMYPFQESGVEFAIESNIRCLISDEMGLGKTVQAIRTLTSRKSELLPAAIFCKSSVKIQWLRELLRWSNHQIIPIVVSTGETFYLTPGFGAYIFSLDLLRRFNGSLKGYFEKIGIKTIIIDECQLIKNHQSKRTVTVRALCNDTAHIIGLSGTPIKNRASEYFSILNILRPDLFSTYESFVWYECQTYNDSYRRTKVGGLRRPKEFHEKTKDFIIRRSRDEVEHEIIERTGKGFAKTRRNYRYDELGEDVQKAWDVLLKDFTEAYDSRSESEQQSFTGQSSTLAFMTKMRHLAGLAKIAPTVEMIEEYLISNERKLVVFLHHIDVHTIMVEKIRAICNQLEIENPTSLTADMSPEIRDRTIQAFIKNKKARIVIASTLAFGEATDGLQVCKDCIVMERQWNPANEVQAEDRLNRMGQQSEFVDATYCVAVGTIDEYFAEIVERKREICAQTLDGKEMNWEESDIMRELAERLAREGRKKWKIS